MKESQMKWLLVASVLASPMEYPTAEICDEAARRLNQGGFGPAACIPKGIDEGEEAMRRMADVLKAISEALEK